MRVAICDDHLTFVDALETLLSNRGHEVVCRSSSPYDGAELGRPGVDVLVLDLDFPGIEGCEAVDMVRTAAPSLPIVVLTAVPDRNLIEQAFDHGADGAVLKTEGIVELESVLSKVVATTAGAGRSDRGPRVRSRQVQALTESGQGRGARVHLTDRELETLAGLASGHTTAEIAASMGIQMVTVRTHVQHLLAKFGAHSRVEVVAAAIRMGLVGSPGRHGGAIRRSS
jgi:two-component system nitrate/nitrite response regulator NarL